MHGMGAPAGSADEYAYPGLDGGAAGAAGFSVLVVGFWLLVLMPLLGPTLPASVRLSPKATTPEKFGWAKPGATVNGKPRKSRKADKSLLDRDVINYPVWVWVDLARM